MVSKNWEGHGQGPSGVEYGLRGFSGSLGLQGHSAKALAMVPGYCRWMGGCAVTEFSPSKMLEMLKMVEECVS